MQLNRLFEMIYLLLNHDKLTASELAERFEVSQRTIYRDVETLSAAGIPIYMMKGKGGGISLLPNFILDKSVLTEEEKQELVSSMQAMQVLSPKDSGEAFAKISSLFGKEKDWIEVDFSSWSQPEKEADYFRQLREAILNRKVVSFSYVSMRGERTERLVHPLKILFKGQAWYLYGFCEERKANRFFKMSRMENLEVTARCHETEIPERVMKADVKEIPLIEAKFRIHAAMAYRVFDEIRHYEKTENGDYLCTVCMPNIDAIVEYACGFGAYCEILSPSAAKEKMKQNIKKLNRIYNMTD